MHRYRASLCAACLALLAASSPRAAEPFRVCLDPDVPPLSSASGERHGVFYEVGERLARALGRPFRVFWWPTDLGKRAIRLTVLADRCDAMLGLPFVKGLVGPRLLVAGPLLELGYVLVLPAGARIARMEDLAGGRVAVAFDSEAQTALATLPGVEPVTFRQPEEAVRALLRGEADAAFVWEPAAVRVEQETGTRLVIVRVDGPRLRWQAGVGVARDKRELRDRLDELIARMRSEIAEIARAYGLRYDHAISWNWLPAATRPRDGHLRPRASAVVPIAAATDAAPEVIERGRELFNSVLGCAHCHGPDAVGPDKARDLRRMRIRYRSDWPETYWRAVLEGRLQTRSGLVMPAWKDTAAREDLEAILLWLSSLQLER
ncbi:MAG: transporter substrate-binding domain-containing protein [Geminicoccaceae bacterium]|nr:transporter substrate-binding domain-containing protein [Geminicoccaceae bacterium]MCS7266467.1 transporter substrate-binding domain-containing protein [Geminicoccaceae bacterium]MDW8340000.1 transporter substrate-binding domain-containing protein [Geminicoccaceae bacterium]